MSVPEIYDTWGNIARSQGLVIAPQGAVSDNGAGAITLGSKVYVMNPYVGSFIEIAAGTYTLADKEALICDVPPTAALGATVTPTVQAWTNDNRKWNMRDKIVLAQRIGTVIYFPWNVPASVYGSAIADLRTTIPGSPTNGQEIVYTDSLTAPTYMWRLRYITAATKWFPQAGSWGQGTSLPTVPATVDKVEYVLTDSLSAPTYEWNLIYDATNTKWRVTGGWGFGTAVPTVSALLDRVPFTLVDSLTVPTRKWDLIYNTGAATYKWVHTGGEGIGTSLPTVPSTIDTVPFTLTDSLSAPTYEWKLLWDADDSKWRCVGGWGLGTAFPTVPSGVDRVPFTLTDSITNATWSWKFIYNAGEATYKWISQGGAAAMITILTNQVHPGTGWANLSTDGPAFTIPRAGIYEVSINARGQYVGADINTYIGLDSDQDTTLQDTYQQAMLVTTGLFASAFGNYRIPFISGEVIKMQYYANVAASFSHRVLSVKPIKVS